MEGKFDFAVHEQAAVTEYLKVFPFYLELANGAKRIAEEALKRRLIRVHSVEARAKDPASFGRKAAKPSDTDPSCPMYPEPLKNITDLSAIRIITFFPRTVQEIDQMLQEEFSIIERSDKEQELIEEEKFGYKSIHYLVRLNDARAALAEYGRFREAITEVQVRTILQHAWAEIEHDIQYKSSVSIPDDIRRRFMALAGLLEIADREFQAIQDDDRALTDKATALVNQGMLDDVEVLPKSLKAYLNKRLGPDDRVSEFSYDWYVRLLKKLGFRTLRQIDICIEGYDDDQLSRILTGRRQGQTSRFEFMLLAGMGEKFIQRHLFADETWFGGSPAAQLVKLRQMGIPVEKYDPLSIGDKSKTPK